MYLAASGVSTDVLDFDTVELSNLHRWLLTGYLIYIHTLVIPVLLLIASLIAVVVDDDDAIADRSFILRAALVV